MRLNPPAAICQKIRESTLSRWEEKAFLICTLVRDGSGCLPDLAVLGTWIFGLVPEAQRTTGMERLMERFAEVGLVQSDGRHWTLCGAESYKSIRFDNPDPAIYENEPKRMLLADAVRDLWWPDRSDADLYHQALHEVRGGSQ